MMPRDLSQVSEEGCPACGEDVIRTPADVDPLESGWYCPACEERVWSCANCGAFITTSQSVDSLSCFFPRGAWDDGSGVIFHYCEDCEDEVPDEPPI